MSAVDLTADMKETLDLWIAELRRRAAGKPQEVLDLYDATSLEEELNGTRHRPIELADLRDSHAVGVCTAIAMGAQPENLVVLSQRVVALNALLRRPPPKGAP